MVKVNREQIREYLATPRIGTAMSYDQDRNSLHKCQSFVILHVCCCSHTLLHHADSCNRSNLAPESPESRRMRSKRLRERRSAFVDLLSLSQCLISVAALSCWFCRVEGFSCHITSISSVEYRGRIRCKRVLHQQKCLRMMTDGGEDCEEFGEDLDTGGIILDDLNWRVEKLRLEEQNTQRFLKSLPRFLPYDECRRWVQAFGRRWETEDDWREWIAMGEKRNAYIPVSRTSLCSENIGRLGLNRSRLLLFLVYRAAQTSTTAD
jgi:hypothetical protein